MGRLGSAEIDIAALTGGVAITEDLGIPLDKVTSEHFGQAKRIQVTKDRTIIVGVIEFFRAATIVNNREYASIQIYSFVAIVYFVICFGFSQFGEWCRRRLGAQELTRVEAGLGR